MSDNKTIWIIGIILIIVVFLGFSNLDRLTAQAATQSTGIENTVNAHACKADDVCETNRFSTGFGDPNQIQNPTHFRNKIEISHPDKETYNVLYASFLMMMDQLSFLQYKVLLHLHLTQ